MIATARHLAWPLALLWSLPVGRVEADVQQGVERYRSGEAQVTLEWFAPATRGKFPAIFLLHGSGGMEGGTAIVFRAVARDFAQRGYVVMIPHLFERTGHTVGQPLQAKEFTSLVEAVEDAIKFAGASGSVDADRIGILGMSMGASIAFIQGARDPRIKAIVSCSGRLPLDPDTKFPPVLILQGSKDRGSPVANIKTFQEIMKAKGIPCANHVYKGMGHNLDADLWDDVATRAAAFFNKYVKNPRKSTTKKSRGAGVRKDSDPGAAPRKDAGDEGPRRDDDPRKDQRAGDSARETTPGNDERTS